MTSVEQEIRIDKKVQKAIRGEIFVDILRCLWGLVSVIVAAALYEDDSEVLSESQWLLGAGVLGIVRGVGRLATNLGGCNGYVSVLLQLDALVLNAAWDIAGGLTLFRWQYDNRTESLWGFALTSWLLGMAYFVLAIGTLIRGEFRKTKNSDQDEVDRQRFGALTVWAVAMAAVPSVVVAASHLALAIIFYDRADGWLSISQWLIGEAIIASVNVYLWCIRLLLNDKYARPRQFILLGLNAANILWAAIVGSIAIYHNTDDYDTFIWAYAVCVWGVTIYENMFQSFVVAVKMHNQRPRSLVHNLGG